jgi:secreted trypsin-like serine protease
MMRKLVSALACIGLLGISTPSHSVVFGEEVLDASIEYPWVASVWIDIDSLSWDGPRRVCSGSLIQPDIVLTAAHCVLDVGLYYVQVGSDTLDPRGELIEVSAVWKHPRYSDRKFVNDIGLLKLSKPATVEPIAYSLAKHQRFVDRLKQYRILGWGINQNEEDPTYLRTAVISNQNKVAASRYKSSFNSKTMIAAGKFIASEKVYAGGCSGDSGGPILATVSGKKMVVGVTSYGAVDCNWGLPTVFTKVSYYEKDLARGLATLLRNETTFNRAAPKVEVQPSITGNLTRGGTATCNPGTWSTNTSRISIRWTSPWSISGSTNPTIQLSNSINYIDTEYACEVTGSNASTSVRVKTSFVLPARPTITGFPSISGVPSFAAPNLGSVATCSGHSWRGTGVTETINWYASLSYNGKTNFLGSGSTITLNEAVEQLASSRWYLTCEVTAANAGGSDTWSTSTYLQAPFKRPAPTASPSPTTTP